MTTQRRKFLVFQATTALLHSLPKSAFSSDRFEPYRGQTISISIPKHPHYDAMIKLLPEFTKTTGIKVEFDQVSFSDLKSRQILDFKKPQPAYDLVAYGVMWKSEYAKADYIQELSGFFKNPSLVDPDFDFEDIVAIYRENIGLVGGWKGYLAGANAKLFGLPFGAETSVLAYKRDLYAKFSLNPPGSYYELERAIDVFANKSGYCPLASRGQIGHQCVHAWLLHLNPMNGKIFEQDWSTRFNSSAGVRALKFLKQVIATGPPGCVDFGQGEMIDAFVQGQCATYLDSTTIFSVLRNRENTKLSGNIGFLPHPRASKQSSQSGGLGLAIAKKSKNPNAAFLLMQWLTSKERDRALLKAGGAPHRISTIADLELQKSYPELIVLRESLKFADPDWRPIIAEWDEINTRILGVAIHGVIQDTVDPKTALDQAALKVSTLMVDRGYFK
jgi:multiple sugar transport system substrate-binding protein